MLDFDFDLRPWRIVYIIAIAGIIYWLTDYNWKPAVVCLLAIIDFDPFYYVNNASEIKYGPTGIDKDEK